MTDDPRLLFLPPLRKRAEELAQERCAYRVVALGGHPWADLPEWLRAQDIETEAHLLADLSRPASRDAVARLVAEALGLDVTSGIMLLPTAHHGAKVRDWLMVDWTGATRVVLHATKVTDPTEALTLIAIATLGASDAR